MAADRAPSSLLPSAPNPDTTLPSLAAAFLERIEETFQQAAHRCRDGVSRSLDLGGRSVALDFAGPALVPALMPAFEHRACSSDLGAPDLVVHLWDSASTGAAVPRPPWPTDAYASRGEIKAHGLGRLRASFSVESGLSVFDPLTRIGYYWVGAAGQVPAWEFAAPLRPLLAWWAAADGGQLAHAAAVGTSRGGVLLAGPGGSGKSTTALACLERGLCYAGDDYVLLRDGGAPEIFSLYGTAKASPEYLRTALPRLAAHGVRTDRLHHVKSILLLNESHRAQLVDRMRLRAIVTPSISPDGRTSIRKASAVEVLRALAPTTLFQLPGAGAQALATLGWITRQVPCFAMGLGRDLDEIAALIRKLADTGAAA